MCNKHIVGGGVVVFGGGGVSGLSVVHLSPKQDTPASSSCPQFDTPQPYYVIVSYR